jgi:hypothetical protein
MTKNQIIAILGSENIDNILHIPMIKYVALTKEKSAIRSDMKDVRFRFNTTNDIMEVIYCRPYSQSGKFPPHEYYDVMDLNGVSTVFEWLRDVETGELIVDYYSFSGIAVIGLEG